MENAQITMRESQREFTNPTNWDRIEAVIKLSGMTTNAFARHIGLARGENLYQIKRGNNGVSFDVAERIVAKFPEVSKLWLLTGDGQMLKGPQSITPWVYFAGSALSALISKGVDMPEVSAANYADHLVEIYTKKGGKL